MSRRAPQTRAPRHSDDSDDVQTLSISSEEGDDDEEEDEEDDDEEQDRGDHHDPRGRGGDDDEEEDDEEEEEEEDDEEDDDEHDDEEEEEEEDDEELDPDALREIGNSDTVPRARFNQVLRQLREAEGRGGQPPAAQQQEQPPAFDLKAKTKERNSKLLNGDEDGAAAIDDEITAFHRAETTRVASEAASQAILSEKVATAVAEVQAKYPVLNDRKRAFNPDVLDEVVALRNVYMGRGDSLPEAMRKAAKRICERGGAGGEDEREERRSGARKPRNEMTLRQKKDAVRNARRIPAAISRAGNGGKPGRDVGEMSERAIANMPEAKFRNLDPRDKAAARGDFVEGASTGRRKRRN